MGGLEYLEVNKGRKSFTPTRELSQPHSHFLINVFQTVYPREQERQLKNMSFSCLSFMPFGVAFWVFRFVLFFFLCRVARAASWVSVSGHVPSASMWVWLNPLGCLACPCHMLCCCGDSNCKDTLFCLPEQTLRCCATGVAYADVACGALLHTPLRDGWPRPALVCPESRWKPAQGKGVEWEPSVE